MSNPWRTMRMPRHRQRSDVCDDQALIAPRARNGSIPAARNIIACAMRNAFPTRDAGLSPRALFDRRHVRSRVRDRRRRTFVGCRTYATARDWARSECVPAGRSLERRSVLPDGWVPYGVPGASGPEAPRGTFLAAGSKVSGPASLPADSFHAVSHEGQFVTVMPVPRRCHREVGRTRARVWDQRHSRDVSRL
jgi:hypothetical protein